MTPPRQRRFTEQTKAQGRTALALTPTSLAEVQIAEEGVVTGLVRASTAGAKYLQHADPI